jgi:hypothetical protein
METLKFPPINQTIQQYFALRREFAFYGINASPARCFQLAIFDLQKETK